AFPDSAVTPPARARVSQASLWAHLRQGAAPRDRERGNRVGSREQKHADYEQNGRRPVGRSTAQRHELLERDYPGNECHPNDAHHPEREERGHQRPATPDAPSTVSHSHLEPADSSIAPGAEQEPERAAAFPKAEI